MNREEPWFGTAVVKVLICSEEIRNILTSLCLPRQPGLFTKTWPQVVRIKAFQWGCLLLYSFFSTPFSLSVRRVSGACLVSKGLMRIWMLQWMLKSERNISLSLSLSQKILNTRGSIQGVMECLRGSSMFAVGKQRSVWTVSTAIHSANISFPISSQQKEQDAGGPPFRFQPLWDKPSKQNAFVQQSQFSGSQRLS